MYCQGRRNRSGWSGFGRTTFARRLKYFGANEKNRSMAKNNFIIILDDIKTTVAI